jgi:hypothetical protein
LNKLIITILIEPFYIYPRVVYWGLKGHWDFIKGKGGWGQMMGTGFKKSEDIRKLESTVNSQT